MVSANCGAKNPLTCRYHGKEAYVQAKQQLSDAFTRQRNARTQQDFEQAKKDFETATETIDATDEGYAELQNAYMYAISLKDNPWMDTLSFQNRLAKAQELRSQDAPVNPAVRLFQDFKNRVLDENAGKPNGGIPGNYFDENSYENLEPENVTELRKAVKNRRGGKGVTRKVYLNKYTSVNGPLEVQPPTDGTPIIIYNKTGFNNIHIDGGRAVIVADSQHGNVITAKNGADVVVIARPNAKTRVEAIGSDNSVLLMEPTENSRATIAVPRWLGGEHRPYDSSIFTKI